MVRVHLVQVMQRLSRHSNLHIAECNFSAGSAIACGPNGQDFTQPGPFGPGIDPTIIFIRPEGPAVTFDESEDQGVAEIPVMLCSRTRESSEMR